MSASAARRVMADTWFINPHNKIDTIAQQMEVYKRALDDCGKPFPDELPMAREVFVAPTRAEAIRLAQPPWKRNTRPIRTGARTR